MTFDDLTDEILDGFKASAFRKQERRTKHDWHGGLARCGEQPEKRTEAGKRLPDPIRQQPNQAQGRWLPLVLQPALAETSAQGGKDR